MVILRFHVHVWCFWAIGSLSLVGTGMLGDVFKPLWQCLLKWSVFGWNQVHWLRPVLRWKMQLPKFLTWTNRMDWEPWLSIYSCCMLAILWLIAYYSWFWTIKYLQIQYSSLLIWYFVISCLCFAPNWLKCLGCLGASCQNSCYIDILANFSSCILL